MRCERAGSSRTWFDVPLRLHFNDILWAVSAHFAIESFTKPAMQRRRWAQRGRKMLALPCILDYVEQLLRGLAQLQKFHPDPRANWTEYDLDKKKNWFKQVHAMLYLALAVATAIRSKYRHPLDIRA